MIYLLLETKEVAQGPLITDTDNRGSKAKRRNKLPLLPRCASGVAFAPWQWCPEVTQPVSSALQEPRGRAEVSGIFLALCHDKALAIKRFPPCRATPCLELWFACDLPHFQHNKHVVLPESHQWPPDPRQEATEKGFLQFPVPSISLCNVTSLP